MAKVDLTHLLYLHISILNKAHLVYKPGVAKGVWVLQRHFLTILQRQNEITRVKHVKHREKAVTLHGRHITVILCYRLHRFLHLRADMHVYHLLITAQLGGMISTYALMMI